MIGIELAMMDEDLVFIAVMACVTLDEAERKAIALEEGDYRG